MSFGRNNIAERRNERANGVFRSAPLGFKIMFITVLTIIAIAFVGVGYMFFNAVVLGNGGYSYNVEYEYGGVHYKESSSYGE